MSENIMAECIRWMSMPEVPSSESLREQIINSVLASEVSDGNSPCGHDAQQLVMGLVQAYHGALECERIEDESDDEVQYLEPREAEQMLLRLYLKVHLHQLPGYDKECAAEGFSWPDALNYDSSFGFEPTLIRKLGIAFGYLDAKRTKQMAEYFARTEAS